MLGRNGLSFWAGPAKKRTGPRPVSQGRPESGGSGGARLGAVVLAPGHRYDCTRGLGRGLWAPPMLRRGPSGPADASPWSIRTSPTLNRPESGGVGVKLRFSGDVPSSPISKFAKLRANCSISLTGSSSS
ncbi:hypothetical protein CDL15_Pgr018502 [Punica granatum]|uniref:Uncharacterized protein n=1 Tax=Punica granatum TaxID=22663 RepID=A0A218WZ61_PUNGR|nr:hypothetical protein CDL15_Pgr018502 [Punica granatum]